MDWLGFVSMLCFSVCYLPQLIRTYRTRTVQGVSTLYWSIVVVGYVTGVLYLLPLKNILLLLTYLMGLVCAVVMLVACLAFRNR